MKAGLLAALNETRAAKRQVVLARWLKGGELALVVDGEHVAGPALPPEALAAVPETLKRDQSRTVETEAGPVFLQVFNPPLRLIVVGAVHIAQALAPMAQMTGYDVTVVDPRRGFANDARFPAVAVNTEWPDDALAALGPDRRTAIVTLTHDPKLDDPALDVALRSDAFYIAALGSRKTHAGRVERLGALGHDAATIARIHGPAGLDLGAVSPAEIALSVLGQMTLALRRPAASGNAA